MSFVTRSMVFHNGLDESIHKLEMEYEQETIVFVFSSEFYMNLFQKKLKDNRNKFKESLSKRFGFEVGNDLLFDLKLYSTVEKRGFLIFWKDDKFECLNSIVLNGLTLTKKNLKE